MYDSTKLLPKSQVDILLNILPTPRQKKYGRKRCSKEALLNGILQVLVNDVAWCKLADCGCSYSSCWRYFKEVQRRGKLKLVFDKLSKGKTNILIGSIDTTTITSFDFKLMTGWDPKHRKIGTKVSLFGDKGGIPADVDFGRGNDNDRIFVEGHLKNTVGMRKKVINFDMLYMGKEFRREMRRKGIRVNMEMRNTDYASKRGPKFKVDWEIYKLRKLLERTNGWIKGFRHLRLRREYLPGMFKGFVYLALIIILIRN